ncbi:MAG: putative 2OG-Fe(II) oxygenase [Alteraurantiacibacter sp.]
MSATPDHYRAQAQSLAASGNVAGARAILDTALTQHPDNAPLANSAGNLAMKLADPVGASHLFAKAAELAPTSLEYAINLAIALSAAQHHRKALAALYSLESQGKTDARYCSVRASCARAARDLAQAQLWYDRSIALNPSGAKALHGRARVALERGTSDAVQFFERSLTLTKGDAQAWLGLAEALDLAGEKQKARELAVQLVAQAPQWTDALRLLAQLRLATGEPDFASHFAEAEARVPGNPAIAHEHIRVLEQQDLFAEAMEAAQNAARRFPENETFALLQASYAGIIGEDVKAQSLFDGLSLQTPDRWLLEARYLIGRDEYARCSALLDRVIADNPLHINAWAVRDFVWRLTDDARGDWLHGQEGLVRMVELPDGDAVLREAVPLLHRLHDNSAYPLGQSLRGGTQTRGALFDRAEPELQRLRDALKLAVENYRSTLPAFDPDHPLLRFRDAELVITSSWSVRLSGGGDFHAAHLHPEGIISSALYCALPDGLSDSDAAAGHIELGRPPPKLRIDLEPRFTLRPKRGHLALFPSTLYHGTRPFNDGQRMTVAFDVQHEERRG